MKGTALNETKSVPQGLKSLCKNCISELSPEGTECKFSVLTQGPQHVKQLLSE